MLLYLLIIPERAPNPELQSSLLRLAIWCTLILTELANGSWRAATGKLAQELETIQRTECHMDEGYLRPSHRWYCRYPTLHGQARNGKWPSYTWPAPMLLRRMPRLKERKKGPSYCEVSKDVCKIVFILYEQ